MKASGATLIQGVGEDYYSLICRKNLTTTT